MRNDEDSVSKNQSSDLHPDHHTLCSACSQYQAARVSRQNSQQVATELMKSEAISDVAAQLQLLNEPGNDILGSQDYVGERQKLARYLGDFNRSAAVRQMEESSRCVREFISDTAVTDALRNISQSVQRTISLTQEIEAATTEQSAGAKQIARATQVWSRLTREISAATSEQSPGANEIAHEMDQIRAVLLHSATMASVLQELSETLARQSEALRKVASRFQTEASEVMYSR